MLRRRLVRLAFALLMAAGAALVGSVEPARATAPTRVANLDDYWNGTASWSLVHMWSQPDYGVTRNDGGFGAGPSIVIGPDGVWNWFYRTSEIAGNDSSCTGHDTEFTLAGTLIRRSTDKGATWSAAQPVVVPGTDNTLPAVDPLWACQATDGSAIWDGTQWNYVFQCLASQTAINFHGCRVTNSSANPFLGTWVKDPANPIIGDDVPGGKLWDQICDSTADDCVNIPNHQLVQQSGANKVGQAGTFSLWRAPEDPGWIYMDFHGVDTQVGYQYQGVAKTQDFHTWVAGGGFNLPTDDIYDRQDSVNWLEPADPFWNQTLLNNALEDIGGGGNAVFPDPVTHRYFNIADASNNPTCGDTTVFDQGILRSSSLTSTTWEQPTNPIRQNPFLYSEQTVFTDEQLPNRCAPSYASMFNDPTTGETYLLYYGRSAQQFQVAGQPVVGYDVLGDYLLKLEFNILANGDATRCVNTNPWTMSGGTAGVDFNVWRDGVWSDDGMCYFALNHDISQNVALPATRDYTSVKWGGSFETRLSVLSPPMGYQSLPATGTVKLTLTQLSALGTVISTDTMTVPLTGTYSRPSHTVTVSPTAATLRYTVSPQNLSIPNVVLADAMFIRPLY